MTTATQHAATAVIELAARLLGPPAARFTAAVPRPVQPTLFDYE